jgi:hypothetical protein
VVPWVIGQWVRGPTFYGREAEIAALLPPAAPGAPGAPGRRLWVAGLRRVGKTSLLRQLELLALDGPRPVLPLSWDLEGVEDAGELARGFADAVLDAEEALARFGVAVAEVEDADLFAALGRLHGALARRGAELLLLCDEADQLLALARRDSELVRRLWRAAAGERGRVVLASSVRLADLAAAGGGEAAVVEGFGEPLLLGAMAAGEARELLRQSRLPAAARPGFDDATVEAIRVRCGDHPMLLQLAGRRCQEAGSLEEGLRRVAADRTVDRLFAVDLELLTEDERRALAALAAAERDRGALAAGAAAPELRRLLALGLLRRAGEGAAAGGVAIRNRLLADWLLR